MNEEKEEIKNVGVLNLKDMSEEDIEEIPKIKNVGVIIAPKNHIGKLSAKPMENVGAIVPYEEGMVVYAGSTVLTSNTLEHLDKPIKIVQAGELTFANDVKENLILQKISSIKNYGMIIVPKSAYGAVMSKCVENCGKVTTSEDYKAVEDIQYDEDSVVYGGKTVLNADTLQQFEKPIKIVQTGKLVFADDLTKDLIIDKIESIKNYGKIIAPRQIFGTVMTKVRENHGKISITAEDQENDE
jgi:hypothetical protein